MTEPVRVDLYTRADCPLCDEAKEVLSRGLRGTPHRLVEHDVAADPALKALYGDEIPVVVVDGVKRFAGRVNPVLLRRLF
ncbi:MAG: glutaredoxin family protein [Planctomycetes bacterium]|nr:glutaredoxin family protein [Planctomycetota bacterium]